MQKDEAVAVGAALDIPPEGLALESVEKDLILKALLKSNWNQTRAAELLSLSRKTLIYRMEKYGISQQSNAKARD
jgi:two-component system NtrC family response regulator